jgi:hypothetical protein
VRDLDAAAIILPLPALCVYTIGTLGVVTGILGRQATHPTLRRMLAGLLTPDQTASRSFAGDVWDLFFIVISQVLAIALIASGINLGSPLPIATGTAEVMCAGIVSIAIFRGTSPA